MQKLHINLIYKTQFRTYSVEWDTLNQTHHTMRLFAPTYADAIAEAAGLLDVDRDDITTGNN